MEVNYLKETLFELFEKFEDYEDIVQDLRYLNSLGELNNNEYNIILKNYEKWLKEWNNLIESESEE